MKVFFDTNVLISAFISRGTCSELYEYCLKAHSICVHQKVLDEIFDKLVNKFHYPKNVAERAMLFVKEHADILPSAPSPLSLCKDADDDILLSAAVNARVDCIVSGDGDFLELKKVQGISVIKPADFWKFEKGRRNTP